MVRNQRQASGPVAEGEDIEWHMDPLRFFQLLRRGGRFVLSKDLAAHVGPEILDFRKEPVSRTVCPSLSLRPFVDKQGDGLAGSSPSPRVLASALSVGVSSLELDPGPTQAKPPG